MTQLQREFAKWGVFRRFMLEELEEELGSLTGYKMIFRKSLNNIGSSMPEAEIKQILVWAIYAPDTTRKEKLEAKALLMLAETTTTHRQRQKIYREIFEE